MTMEHQDYRHHSFYNGTFRSIGIFALKDCHLNEKDGKYYLNNPHTPAIWMLDRMEPLVVYRQETNLVQDDQVNYFIPRYNPKILQTLTSLQCKDLDVIVVTKTYAHMAYTVQEDLISTYKDRLYIPVPVYTPDTLNPEIMLPIGAVGFQKVFPGQSNS